MLNPTLSLSIVTSNRSISIPGILMISHAQNTATVESLKPNIIANSIYNERAFVLGKNVKNFVIVLPRAYVTPILPYC